MTSSCGRGLRLILPLGALLHGYFTARWLVSSPPTGCQGFPPQPCPCSLPRHSLTLLGPNAPTSSQLKQSPSRPALFHLALNSSHSSLSHKLWKHSLLPKQPALPLATGAHLQTPNSGSYSLCASSWSPDEKVQLSASSF